jgi:hypothetical protein
VRAGDAWRGAVAPRVCPDPLKANRVDHEIHTDEDDEGDVNRKVPMRYDARQAENDGPEHSCEDNTQDDDSGSPVAK